MRRPAEGPPYNRSTPLPRQALRFSRCTEHEMHGS